ncbi:MAG: DUF2911 domain-containing protein [Sediminibacterium sp.]
MKLFVSLACLLVFFSAQAQKAPELDGSPMDMSYWPANYPKLKLDGKAKAMPVARLIYSRPMKNNRPVIFGKVVPYGVVYRLGANESAEIEFFSNVKIGGKLITKGRYTMQYIVEENMWTIIINRDNYTWGHFSYKKEKDVVRKNIDIEKTNDITEAFTMYFEETRIGANLVMLFDDVKAVLPITLVK